ncbi:hypothetical protein Tco_0605478 [Tanacetum coccineum]
MQRVAARKHPCSCDREGSFKELQNTTTDLAEAMSCNTALILAIIHVRFNAKYSVIIDKTQSRVVDLIVSTLRLSNLDIVASYVFRGGNNAPMPAAKSDGNDVPWSSNIGFTREYVAWFQSSNAREVTLYEETFEKRWASFVSSFFVLHRHKTLQGNPIGEGNFVLQVVSKEFLINIKRDEDVENLGKLLAEEECISEARIY